MKKIISLLLTMCIMLSFGINYVTAETTTPPAGNTDTLPDVEQEPLTGEGDALIQSNYSLVYSTKYLWTSDMPNYNCYAYALGKTDDFHHPGEYSGYSYDGRDSVDTIANHVVNDLKSSKLNYGCVKKQKTKPSYIDNTTNIIALRKYEGDDSTVYSDYHFAKLNSSGWYHKPGGNAILKFKNDPSSYIYWTNERYDGKNYLAPTIIYNSDIVYILFRKQHSSITWTGEHYHSKNKHFFKYSYNCVLCGTGTYWQSKACSGPPCTLPSGIIAEPELY